VISVATAFRGRNEIDLVELEVPLLFRVSTQQIDDMARLFPSAFGDVPKPSGQIFRDPQTFGVMRLERYRKPIPDRRVDIEDSSMQPIGIENATGAAGEIEFMDDDRESITGSVVLVDVETGMHTFTDEVPVRVLLPDLIPEQAICQLYMDVVVCVKEHDQLWAET
jgi:hypothetical protein